MGVFGICWRLMTTSLSINYALISPTARYPKNIRAGSRVLSNAGLG